MRYLGRAIRGFLLLTAVTVLAQDVSGAGVRWETDPQAALQRSAASGRPVLMKFTAEWCGHCKNMERTTFADPKMVEVVHQNFIPLLIDTDQHQDLAKELKITGLPALLIVAPDLTIVDRIRGFQTTDRLLPRLNTVLTTHRFPTRVPALPAAQERTTTAATTTAGAATAGAEPNPFAAPPVQPTTAAPSTQPNPFESNPNPFETNPFAQQTTVAAAPTRPAAVQQSPGPMPMSSARYGGSFAQAPAPMAAGPVAFQGLCLTSVVEQRKLISGTPEFAATHRGQLLHFQSAAQRDRFFESPEKYWPVLDGICGMTLLETGAQVPGELKYAAVFREQIWVFQTRELMQRFIDSPADYVQQLEERQKTANSVDRSY